MLDKRKARSIRIGLAGMMLVIPLLVIRLDFPGKAAALWATVVFEIAGTILLPLLHFVCLRKPR